MSDGESVLTLNILVYEMLKYPQNYAPGRTAGANLLISTTSDDPAMLYLFKYTVPG